MLFSLQIDKIQVVLVPALQVMLCRDTDFPTVQLVNYRFGKTNLPRC
jgi:hypothetical protein